MAFFGCGLFSSTALKEFVKKFHMNGGSLCGLRVWGHKRSTGHKRIRKHLKIQGNFKSYVAIPRNHSKIWLLTDFGHALFSPLIQSSDYCVFHLKGNCCIAAWECRGMKAHLLIYWMEYSKIRSFKCAQARRPWCTLVQTWIFLLKVQ